MMLNLRVRAVLALLAVAGCSSDEPGAPIDASPGAGDGGIPDGSATDGSPGGTDAAGPSGSAFFADDFEGGTAGKQPTGWDNFLSYQKNTANPQGDGTLALVDTQHAHSGTKAVHFHGGGNPAMLTRALPAGTNRLYLRAWVFQTRQLGMNPGANHETLMGIRKATGSANDEVRFGEIKGVIGTNEVPTDNIAPKMAQWGKGPAIAANRWSCFEVAFLADQAQHVLEAWIDGTQVHAITAPDQWQNGVMPATWLAGKFVEVMFGWHSFSGNTNDVWMDDIALGTERIGCN